MLDDKNTLTLYVEWKYIEAEHGNTKVKYLNTVLQESTWLNVISYIP